ncbi:MAG: hypothetical protein JWO06_1474 [Bacteroidota bacterium]|nr:hypothetical protein [Bacteroidota bacterium]
MKNPLTQFSIAIIAFIALTFLMSYTRPSAEEPKQYILVHGGEKEVNQKLSEGWHLQGGVSYRGNFPEQAMVK